ncbi:MAG: hypothetical protein KGI54_13635 [Pseudomonadota bacterium]|nr:hypothetical protein [Pseudomonadota bacterium]
MKVEVKAETPSEKIINASNKEVVAIDANGRRIVLKDADVMASFDLVEALGELAQNRTYLQMCFPVMFVKSIDDVQVYTPKTKLEVKALIKQLGSEGLLAVQEAIEASFKKDEDDTESIKKS